MLFSSERTRGLLNGERKKKGSSRGCAEPNRSAVHTSRHRAEPNLCFSLKVGQAAVEVNIAV